jgi:hypothetical protein
MDEMERVAQAVGDLAHGPTSGEGLLDQPHRAA